MSFELSAGLIGFTILPAISVIGTAISVSLWARDRSARMVLVTVVPVVSVSVLLLGFIVQWP